jgi:hypothetical protein
MHWNGTSWAAATTLTNANIRFLDANAPDDVWGIGHDDASPANGVIAHWDGATWKTWRTSNEAYTNVASSAPNDTWVAGVDGAMRHFDGVGWTSTSNIGMSPSGTAAISGLISFSSNNVLAVSTLYLAYRYRGAAYGRFPSLPFPDPFAASVNLAMWGTSATNTWVATAKGEVFRYDGGTAWTRSFMIDPSGGLPATAIWGSSASDVWISSADGRVFHFDGAAWTPTTVSTLRLDKLWGTGPSDVWAFGIGGAFHFDGTTWTRFALSDRDALGAAGSGPGDIYVVTFPDANNHALWHWNGTAWSAVANVGATTRLENVIAVAPNLVFVVARNGHIHHWNGSTWTDDLVEASAELKYLAASAEDDVIAASDRELFHWDGKQWSGLRPPVDFVPNTSDYVPLADLLVTPGRIDMLLSKYRIRSLIRTRPLKCRATEDNCTDAVDNDCDGKIDSTDEQCP